MPKPTMTEILSGVQDEHIANLKCKLRLAVEGLDRAESGEYLPAGAAIDSAISYVIDCFKIASDYSFIKERFPEARKGLASENMGRDEE